MRKYMTLQFMTRRSSSQSIKKAPVGHVVFINNLLEVNKMKKWRTSLKTILTCFLIGTCFFCNQAYAGKTEGAGKDVGTYAKWIELENYAVTSGSYTEVSLPYSGKFAAGIVNIQEASTTNPTITLIYLERDRATIIATVSITSGEVFLLKPYGNETAVRFTDATAGVAQTITANIGLSMFGSFDSIKLEDIETLLSGTGTLNVYTEILVTGDSQSIAAATDNSTMVTSSVSGDWSVRGDQDFYIRMDGVDHAFSADSWASGLGWVTAGDGFLFKGQSVTSNITVWIRKKQ